ncbi:MAG: G5 domain-containing protein, partial [Chloroflexi bacterium]|nr:G5 domain-containing protein [Chloroflexota bacterium]
MRDYTSRSRAQQTAALLPRAVGTVLFAVMMAFQAGCAGPQATAANIAIQVQADGTTTTYAVPSGSTVQQALASAGVPLHELDRVQPPVFTVLTQDATVQITRITERFEVESEALPYERQTIRNEALPEGETRLLQPGVNGAQETTYRILEEEGIEVSRTIVKTTVQTQPIPEIIMVGAQAAFSPVPVAGTLAYLSGSTAWVMSGDSGSRRPLLLDGKLDGRVFKL